MRRDRRPPLTSPLGRLAARPALTASVLLVLALGLRLAEVEHARYRPVNDARSYLVLATQVARIGDYSARDGGAGGTRGPSAYFPPAYPYLLAAVDELTGHTRRPTASAHAARIAQALLGTVVVGLIGLVALELYELEIALIAIAIAAVYPPLIETSSVVVAETLLTALELAAVYATLRALRAYAPLRWILAAGGLVGLAVLTHENGILLLIPLAFAVRRTPAVVGRGRVWAPALLAGTAVLVLVPWIVRDAVELHAFVPISDESGITLAGTYNPVSAAAKDPPWKWLYYLELPGDRGLAREAPTLTETQLDAKLESRALSYISHHPASPFEVALDNTLRLLELEGAAAWRTSAASIGVPLGLARIGVVAFWVMALLALAGLLTRAGRATPGWVWGVVLVMWLSVVLVNAETPRFREPLDPFVIVLAACGLASTIRAVTGARAP